MTKEFEDKGNNYSIRENVNIGEVVLLMKSLPL